MTAKLQDTLTRLRIDGGRSSPGFDEETRAFLQQRLGLLSGTLAAITAFLLVAFMIANASSPDDGVLGEIVNVLIGFPNSILTAIVLVTTGLFATLRRRRLSPRMLAFADGLFLQALIAPCLVLYARLHTFSFSGFPVVVPFLCLFVLARAVLVPSTALRTAVLSASAPMGVLAVQLVHGASFAFPGQPYPPGHFIDMVVQNQVLLVAAISVGAIASRVNLGLRRRSYDAQRLGQYDVEGRIGSGAMGDVYLARHALLKRPTAVKLLRPEIAGEATLRRFEQEVRQTSRLTHPNTVSIFDYGHTADGVFYYAMEYLVGANLREIIELTGPMPPARVIHVLAHACGALQEAHDKRIVHRDIKPANVMLCWRGGEPDTVKILDFGLAKTVDAASSEAAGSIVGTPETMAPEAIHPYAVSPRSDLYSLAVVGYYLLTGRAPFEAPTVSAVLRLHRTTPPTPPSRHRPSAPRDLEAVILRGLAKDPGHRFQTARIVADRLRACTDAGGWSREQAIGWWKEFEREHPRLRPDDGDALPGSSEFAELVSASFERSGDHGTAHEEGSERRGEEEGTSETSWRTRI